jgi:DNA-binding IclR family transcriptional regulator
VTDKDRKRVRESDRQVDTVAKALTILNCFSTNESELSLKTLSEKTGLYKSRIMRLCGTLSAQGFLVKTSRATYELGPRVMILGKIYEKTHNLLNSGGPILPR